MVDKVNRNQGQDGADRSDERKEPTTIEQAVAHALRLSADSIYRYDVKPKVDHVISLFTPSEAKKTAYQSNTQALGRFNDEYDGLYDNNRHVIA